MRNNITPIRNGPRDTPEDSPQFTVSMESWVNGVPFTIKTWPVATFEDGFQFLRTLGHYKEYDHNCAGYVRDQHGTIYAILHIWEHTYRVDKIGEEETK